MTLQNTYDNAVLNLMFGASIGAGMPTDLYFALSTTTPAKDGTNVTEPSGGAGYSRVHVVNNGTNFGAASAEQKANLTDIVFATPTGSWGTLTYVVVYDDPTSTAGSHVFDFEALNSSFTPNTSGPVKLLAGDFVVTAN